MTKPRKRCVSCGADPSGVIVVRGQSWLVSMPCLDRYMRRVNPIAATTTRWAGRPVGKANAGAFWRTRRAAKARQ